MSVRVFWPVKVLRFSYSLVKSQVVSPSTRGYAVAIDHSTLGYRSYLLLPPINKYLQCFIFPCNDITKTKTIRGKLNDFFLTYKLNNNNSRSVSVEFPDVFQHSFRLPVEELSFSKELRSSSLNSYRRVFIFWSLLGLTTPSSQDMPS